MSIMAARALLSDRTVRAELTRAWFESNPGPVGGHEEGGFICKDLQGNLSVDRWPSGSADMLDVPPHARCRRNNEPIVATFHTHPHTGADYDPLPSDTDLNVIREDTELKGSSYIGEYVIADTDVYLIAPDGRYSVLGTRQALFTEAGGP
jgi:hypothetical protein